MYQLGDEFNISEVGSFDYLFLHYFTYSAVNHHF